MFPSTFSEGVGWAHLHHLHCLPLLWVEVGEELTCIIHNVSSSTIVFLYLPLPLVKMGGAHLNPPHCVSFYLVWRVHYAQYINKIGDGGGANLHLPAMSLQYKKKKKKSSLYNIQYTLKLSK